MAGRVTISAGTAAVILTGLDATNVTPAYLDAGLTAQVFLPRTVPAGAAIILYAADTMTLTPTVTDATGNVLSAVTAPCMGGRPISLGPFPASAASANLVDGGTP